MPRQEEMEMWHVIPAPPRFSCKTLRCQRGFALRGLHIHGGICKALLGGRTEEAGTLARSFLSVGSCTTICRDGAQQRQAQI